MCDEAMEKRLKLWIRELMIEEEKEILRHGGRHCGEAESPRNSRSHSSGLGGCQTLLTECFRI